MELGVGRHCWRHQLHAWHPFDWWSSDSASATGVVATGLTAAVSAKNYGRAVYESNWRIYVSDGLHFGVDTFLAALPRLVEAYWRLLDSHVYDGTDQ